MDTGKQYITLCQKAKEIQESWQPREGDFIAGTYCGVMVYTISSVYRDPVIWLPRQDQLQEIVGVSHVHPPFLDLQRWHDWAIIKVNADYWDKFASMEQLWFAFIMKQRYNKVWSIEKDEWVKLSV